MVSEILYRAKRLRKAGQLTKANQLMDALRTALIGTAFRP
jgi:hypothetical protein